MQTLKCSTFFLTNICSLFLRGCFYERGGGDEETESRNNPSTLTERLDIRTYGFVISFSHLAEFTWNRFSVSGIEAKITCSVFLILMSFQSMFTWLFSIQWQWIKTLKAVKLWKTTKKHNKSIKSCRYNLCTIFQVFWNTALYFCDGTLVIWTVSYVLFVVFRPWQLQSPSAFSRWGKRH